MSEQPEFFTYTRDEFMDEFVHPDDRAAVEEARQMSTPLGGARHRTSQPLFSAAVQEFPEFRC